MRRYRRIPPRVNFVIRPQKVTLGASGSGKKDQPPRNNNLAGSGRCEDVTVRSGNVGINLKAFKP